MSKPVIVVNQLGKRYRIGLKHENGLRNFREDLLNLVKAPFRNLRRLRKLTDFADENAQKTSDIIWALKDVSFEVNQGEVVGIIGRNGAGKSTLLKVLSRIVEPTEGYVELRGRVASLLEVGTGFHRELTGRENIYLNGSILGMRKWEIDKRLDEIVAFSEIEKFIDTPVKHYSSGMYVRLAFAVAAHLDPEILLVDEVLAVGDIAFQKKCLGKMGDIAKGGRTVLFVSHNMGAILELCQRTILLNQGRITESGEVKQVVSTYLQSFLSKIGNDVEIEEPDTDKGVLLRRAAILNQQGEVSSDIDFHLPFFIGIEFEVKRPISQLSLWIRLVNECGVKVLYSWVDFQSSYQSGIYRGLGKILGQLLAPGRYYLDIAAEHYRVETYHYVKHCLAFDIINTTIKYDSSAGPYGVICPEIPWQVEIVNEGVKRREVSLAWLKQNL